MEDYELLESPNVLQLYLEAFELQPTYALTQRVQNKGDAAKAGAVSTYSFMYVLIFVTPALCVILPRQQPRWISAPTILP